jgi:hypothetical protein
MAKTKRKWIDLDYSSPTALTADYIPYDATQSVKDAIQGLSITGIQGPIGATGLSSAPPGVTGLQGPQGITGPYGGPSGETGIQGVTGLVGLQGSQGVTGLVGLGETGVQGSTGVSFASPIPNSYVTLTGPIDATSSSFVDIPGLSASVTLDSASEIFATMSFEIESYGAGSYPTGAFRIIYTGLPGDSSGTALEKFLLPDDVSLGTVTHHDGPFPASISYTVKGQFRRVSGQQKVRLNGAQLYAQSLSGGKGDVGNTGVQGVTGFGVAGSTGILGPEGPSGATGVLGMTGIQGLGLTGLQGATGLEGPTGILGPQGITGVAMASDVPSSFVYFDSSHQLFDNTSYEIIPGLNTTIIVDASGSQVFSTMTLLTDSTSRNGIGQYITGSFRIVVGDQTSLAFERFVQNDDDLEPETIHFRTGPLADGTYNVEGQVCVVPKLDTTSYGDKSFGIRKGQLFVESLQGTVGPDGLMGPRGYDGATGVQGMTGLGIQGYTGLQGLQGTTGIAGLGVTGLSGPTGVQGATGLMGGGETGAQGITGVGTTGVQGATGLMGGGATGIQGQTGIQGLTGLFGSTGSQGITGIGSQNSIAFNSISRYQTDNAAGAEVWAVSSSTVYHNVSWNRSGTTLNIYRDAHGHATGNQVIIRNTNKDYQVAPIDSTTLDSFSITTTSTDGTIGDFGAYSLGFTYAHDASPSSGGTLYAPQGDHSDCQILSLRIRTGNRLGSTYNLIVPASAINGAGANTSRSDCFLPDFNVRNDADSFAAVAATMSTNIGGSYSTFQFANLGAASLSRMIVLHF